MTTFRSHTRAKTSTPLFDCAVDQALVHSFPFLTDRKYADATRP